MKRERAVLGILAAVVIIFTGLTYARNMVWQSEMRMWEDVIQKSPGKARGYSDLGFEYYKMALYDMAIINFDKAITLDPEKSDDYVRRGRTYAAMGRFAKGIEDLEKALTFNPAHFEAYNIHISIGVAYAEAGQIDKAFEQFNKAILMDQDHAMAYNNRGLLYVMTGDKTRAALDYRKACDLGDGNGCNALRELTRGNVNSP